MIKNNQPKPKLKLGFTSDLKGIKCLKFGGIAGKPMTSEEFIHSMDIILPEFFKSEDELRKIWSNPQTRKAFLDRIAELGFTLDQLENLQKIVNAEKSDLFDVLAYISFAKAPISRELRVRNARPKIFANLSEKQQEFLDFVLQKYVEQGS